MPRRKKKKDPDPLTVPCPIRGHKHALTYVPHPGRPDLLIAYCGQRSVSQIPNPQVHPDVEPPSEAVYDYSVPSYQDKGE